MTLKNLGRTKKVKFIKCDTCKERFDLNEEEIVRIEKFSYVECPYCNNQILLKNN